MKKPAVPKSTAAAPAAAASSKRTAPSAEKPAAPAAASSGQPVTPTEVPVAGIDASTLVPGQPVKIKVSRLKDGSTKTEIVKTKPRVRKPSDGQSLHPKVALVNWDLDPRRRQWWAIGILVALAVVSIFLVLSHKWYRNYIDGKFAGQSRAISEKVTADVTEKIAPLFPMVSASNAKAITDAGTLTRDAIKDLNKAWCEKSREILGQFNNLNGQINGLGTRIEKLEKEQGLAASAAGQLAQKVEAVYAKAQTPPPPPVSEPVQPEIVAPVAVAPPWDGLPGHPVEVSDLKDWFQNHLRIGKKSQWIYAFQLLEGKKLVRINYENVPNWQSRVCVEFEKSWINQHVLVKDILDANGNPVLPRNVRSARFYIKDDGKDDGATLHILTKKPGSGDIAPAH